VKAPPARGAIGPISAHFAAETAGFAAPLRLPRDPEPFPRGVMGWERDGSSITIALRRGPSCRYAITFDRRSLIEGRGMVFTAVGRQ
jgi:hypothetical protein